MANIAEGAGRGSDPDFARFLDIAAGSLSETEAHVIVAGDLGFAPETDIGRIGAQVSELRRMIYGLQSTLRRRTHSPSAHPLTTPADP